MQVERESLARDEYSGERVRNTWAILPQGRDNPAKVGLRPDKTTGGNPGGQRALSLQRRSLEEKPAAYQLVGRVTAYQGNDG